MANQAKLTAFDRLMHGLAAVPKKELDHEISKYEKAKAKKKAAPKAAKKK